MSSLLESLFFQTYYSYLKGNFESSKMYYQFLKEEFKKSGRKDSLSPHQLLELKKVKKALETGYLPKNQWLTEKIEAQNPNPENDRVNQVELVRVVHAQGEPKLREILGGTSDITLYDIEHPCGPYGAVDMVYSNPTTVYPLEVKVGEGKHDIIGQIQKYELFFRLQLHLKFYEIVKSVTLCGSYNQFTLSELKKLGVITVEYELREGKLDLFKV